MSDGRDITVVFDGSFNGLLCVVYAHYYDKLQPDRIVEENFFQQTLSTEYVHIETEYEKASRVFSAVEKKISAQALEQAYESCLHDENEKRFIHIFRYLILGFRVGHRVDDYTREEYVLAVQKMSRYVSMENHKLTGFCRFAETKEGLLYADISPVNNVLQLLANHFADRLMNEQWIIHDTKRKIAALYDGKGFLITEAPAFVRPEFSDNEEKYQKLWQHFFKTIAVENRINPKLQKNLLPKRYRRHMVEFFQ